jgi:hypothetical protein
MTSNPRMFTSLDEDVDDQDKITFSDNSKGKVQALGKVAISNDFSVSNVLLVAPLSFNLLSVGSLCDLGLQCLFTSSEVVSKMYDESAIFKGFRYNNLYLWICLMKMLILRLASLPKHHLDGYGIGGLLMLELVHSRRF